MPDILPDNESRPSLSDAINAVMADPSIIQGALEALRKSGIGQSQTAPAETRDAASVSSDADSPPPAQDTGELVRTLAPMLSMLSSPPRGTESGGDADRRAALLVALRPYLSEGRREAIDYIIKISQVSDLIKKAGR